MLFMHKGAEKYPHLAIYRGERPKTKLAEGEEDQYVHIHPNDNAAACERVMQVMNLLDIVDRAVRISMMNILNEWCTGTPYDLAQRDIASRMSKDGMEARKNLKINAEWRYYNNYIDLVLALYGESMSKPTLEKEESLAKDILKSEDIQKAISSVSKKINGLAATRFDKASLNSALKELYKSLRKEMDWDAWQSNFHRMTTAEQIPFLYDITMALKKEHGLTEQPMLKGKINKDDMRMNVSTPNEDFYWSSRARWANVPIWAAPSFTTQFMLEVAKRADATTDELQVFAYGIFAFWSQCYPHTATPVHRMYGVMTAARDFGIPELACSPDTMYEQAISFLRNPQEILQMSASSSSSSK